MRYSLVCFVVAAAASCADAWTVPQPHHGKKELLKTVNNKGGWIPAAITAFTLATAPMIVSANDVSNLNPTSPTMNEQPSLLVAGGAYIPEDSYFSADLSLPSYNNENTNSLVGNAQKIATPEQQAPKKAPPPKKKKAPPKNESEEKKAQREAQEAKAAAKAEEREREKYEKKLAEYERKKADFEKAEAAKAERAANKARLNAKRGVTPKEED